MSKFNTTATPVAERPGDTTNLAGANAFAQDEKVELASILLTSFVKDQYYRSADDTLGRVKELLSVVEPSFAAKAALFARDEFGMRSISHVVAAELARRASGQRWAKDFYNRVVVRPDDMTEILAYYYANCGSAVPKAMKNGFSKAIGRMDGYKLAKYRSEGKDVSLVDVVNLVHPVPTDRNRDALAKLVAGTLRNDATWESRMSAAGPQGNKAEVWASLMEEGRMPYFALLRNLRNIEQTQDDALIERAIKQLVEDDPGSHRILPFQFLNAYNAVSEGRVKKAVSEALDRACANVPALSGRMLIATDHSGSMGSFHPGTNQYTGDTFSAIMFKSTNVADLMVFGTDAGLVGGANPGDSTLTLAEQIGALPPPAGHGTSFHRIFEVAERKYDRVVIFSDAQGWQESDRSHYYGYENPAPSLRDYERRVGHRPFVYCFDLAGYGSLQFPEERVFQLAGFSEKVFDLMAALEQDRHALVNRIESIAL